MADRHAAIAGSGAILADVAGDRAVLYLIVKAVISGIVVTLASEVARRSSAWALCSCRCRLFSEGAASQASAKRLYSVELCRRD